MREPAGSLTMGIVGAGAMGRGIAQLFALAGHRIRLHDARPEATGEARTFIAGMLGRQVEKGSLSSARRDEVVARIDCAEALADLRDCDVIVEAILEDPGVKQALFRELEALVGPQSILASNTSSLSISFIASVCNRPERVCGLHFFNPVPLMKLAEVIPGLRTDPIVVERLRGLVEAAGHRAVIAADQPGFLVNHAGRALYTEGLRIVEERVSDFADVDRVMREAMGFRMGPFELLDLTGLDVSAKVMQSIYDQFQQDPRYRPSSLVPPRIAAGLFGRKTGRGFYLYEDGAKQEPPEPSPAGAAPASLWIAGDECRESLESLCAAACVRVAAAPDDPSGPVLMLTLWGEDVAGAAARLSVDPARCVAVDPLPDFRRRRTLMRSVATRDDVVATAASLLAGDGAAVTIIADSAGFIAQRIAAMIVNTGCEIAQRGIASPADIDDAVRIGLGYPEGPLAMGDRIGPRRVLAILDSISTATGDPRYRPSLWLRRRARLGLPLGVATA